MDDLIAYARTLLIADATLIAIFGASSVTVKSPGGEAADVYPEIIISGADGKSQAQGEGGEFAREGVLTLTAIDRDGDGHLGLETVWPMSNQIKFLLAGKEDPETGQIIGGLVNAFLPGANNGRAAWKVVVCRIVDPSGPQNDPDPLIAKIRQTFKIMLMRV